MPTTTSSNFAAILAIAGAGASSLSSVLASGNTTGGSDIVISSGDAIDAPNNGAGVGFDFLINGSDGGGGLFAGGDIIITPGQGSGGGADGEVVLDGDASVTGDLGITNTVIASNIRRGAGSPESVVVANIGDLYQRTDGSSGNALYIKSASNGGNTGWVPAGPRVVEEFVSVGAAVYTTARNFFQSVSLAIDICVYWNGIRQREGAGEDFTVTAANQITFVVIPPVADFITIEYLPT